MSNKLIKIFFFYKRKTMNGDFKEYGVIAGDVVVANSGESKILGDLSSLNAVTGEGTVVVTRQYNIGALNTSAQSQYDYFISITPDTTSSDADISGQTFVPGTHLLTNAGITISNNTVTLDGSGTYVFQLPNGGLTTTTTTSPVSFNLINGATASSVYWMVNGNVNIQSQNGNITAFVGSVISQGNITLGVGSTSAGSLATPVVSGIITLNSNVITAQSLQQKLDNVAPDYIILINNVADAQAIQLNTTNVNGGISIKSGLGGILLSSTDSITLSGSTNVFERWGTGGSVKKQPSEMMLTDINGQTLSIAELLSRIATIPATVDRTVTLDTAVNIVEGIPGVSVDDSIDFTLINLSNSTDSAKVTIAAGTGGTIPSGQNMIVAAASNDPTTYYSSGSGTFRIRLTNVNSGTEAYTVYRIA